MFQNVTMLHIEDDDVDAEAVERDLRAANFCMPIKRANCGMDALEKLHETAEELKLTPPCLILLDMNLPDMSGVEFLKQLRQDPHWHQAPVFVLTNSMREDDLRDAYEQGIVGYLHKDDHREVSKIPSLFKEYLRSVKLPPLDA